MSAQQQHRLLGEILVARGAVTEADVQKALEEQRRTEEPLGKILLRMGKIDSATLASALGEQLGMEPLVLSEMKIPPEIIDLINPAVARQQRVIPVRKAEDGSLVVAMENPMDLLVIDTLRAALGMPITPALASEEEISIALEKYYGAEERTIDSMMKEISQQDISALGISTQGLEEELGLEVGEDAEAPVVKLVQQIINEAYRSRASDIHIEPMERKLRIRYRIDGVCHVVQELPKKLQGPLISRIKIMANMDIAERRLPLDGRIQLTLDGAQVDFRVSTLPGLYGESTVLRLLEKSSVALGLRDLGFMDDDYRLFQNIIRRANGVFLVTGPTGSGKSTTLNAALTELNKPDRKIITVEDPVEYQVTGINQVQVKEEIGLTFARALRAILRQAPNIIMVGEIRDTETAEIAIQAALTGHLVFSTLHTNDAPGAVTRLIDMGVKPFLVASAVQAVMAQRLVRRLCTSCKEEYTPREDEVEEIYRLIKRTPKTLFRPRGCPNCNNTGYRGRIGIFEIMEVSDPIRDLIMKRASSAVIRRKARELGMRTLAEDGARKVVNGITTMAEVTGAAASEEDVTV